MGVFELVLRRCSQILQKRTGFALTHEKSGKDCGVESSISNSNKNNSNGTPSCVILNDTTGSTRIAAKAPTTSIKMLIEGIQF